MTTAIDPVCGMEVDVNNPAATSEYDGETYYFCSKGCKKSFDKEPEKYLGHSHEEGHSHDGGHDHDHH